MNKYQLRLKNSALLIMCEVYKEETDEKVGHGWTLSLHDGRVRPELSNNDNIELKPGSYSIRHTEEVHLVVFTDRIQ